MSGKIEICCQAKADLLNSFGFSNKTYAAYPEYIVPELGYETTFKNGDIKGEKGEYPYLLYNHHYIRRSHTVFNNCPWLREAWPNRALDFGDVEELKAMYGADLVSDITILPDSTMTNANVYIKAKACALEGEPVELPM